MASTEAHLVATCGSCGAPQPLTLAAPLGACEHCGEPEPIGPALRARLDQMRAKLAQRDQSPRQLTSAVLVAGDSLHGAGIITIVVCWLLFGGVALYISFSHDVAFSEFIRGGKPPQQWWLLWSMVFGIALSVLLLEFGVARVRGLSAEALPSPPIHEGAPPRCRYCAADLQPGRGLRRCGSCHADNLVIGTRYLRAENDLDRALDRLEKQFDQDLKARIDTGGTIAMSGGLAPFFILFGGPVIGLFTPGKPVLWLIPGVTVLLAAAMALFARRRRLPVEAIELLSIGDRVYMDAPVNGRRGVCAQLMLENGPVSLLGKNADKAEFAVATQRTNGELDVEFYRVQPGTALATDAERARFVLTDLWVKTKNGPPTIRPVYLLTADDGWRTFLDEGAAPHLEGRRSDESVNPRAA